MGGVEDIEQNFQERCFNEAPLAVIHIDGHKGGPGGEAAGEQRIG